MTRFAFELDFLVAKCNKLMDQRMVNGVWLKCCGFCLKVIA